MRLILQVRDQLFRAVGCGDWIAVDDFGETVHHVGRLIKSNLRNPKVFQIDAFLVEEYVSTWRQIKFNQSTVVKSSRARTSWSLWVLWYSIVSCTYVAGAKSLPLTDISEICDQKSCYDLLERA